MAEQIFDYDFVISYASEDNLVANELYSLLAQGGAKVFYAPAEQSKLWGENLYEYLAEIYSKKGLFFIPLVSKHYISKQWTRHEWKSAQERALSLSTKAYILPIRIDDTPLPGLLSTIAYQSLQDKGINRISELALEKLKLANAGVELVAENSSFIDDKAWRYIRQPSQRNSFLQHNNYLDSKSNQFALNSYTQNLVQLDLESKEFISLVAIPVPDAIDFDLDDLSEKLGFDKAPYGKGVHDSSRPWLAFNIGNLSSRFSASKDFVRYEQANSKTENNAFGAKRFMRFSEEGAIEYAVGNYVSFQARNVRAFNFIYVVGLFWKFVNFAVFSYTHLNYHGACQIIVNMSNTKNTFLANFASDQQGSKWTSPTSPNFESFDWLQERIGQTIDPNLQFVFEISISKIRETPEVSQEVVIDLSKKLQRSFNYEYDERHYVPKTKEFPWDQYSVFGKE